MAKITKKVYNTRKLAIAMEITKVQAEIARLISAEQYETLNALHDKEWDLGQDAAALEREWSRRNWTGADYSSWDLVSSNID